MMRKMVLAGIALAFACFILTTGAGPARAETVLKAVTAWPKTATEFKAFTIFTDTVDKVVAKKAPGQLKIRFVGGPEAVKTPTRCRPRRGAW